MRRPQNAASRQGMCYFPIKHILVMVVDNFRSYMTQDLFHFAKWNNALHNG